MVKALMSVGVFVTAYYFIATEKINKTIAAILGASAVLLMHLVSFEEAMRAVDFNVVFLLVGMMTSVYILSRTGFFEWVAVGVAKRAGGDPWKIMLLLLSVSAVLSAFLDNVTTIIMLVPVTILITQLLELSPVPFVIMEAIVSNIGGTSTLIGDPPNIIIGSSAGLTFNSFIVHLGPVVLVVFAVFIGTLYLMFGKKFDVPEEVRARVKDAVPHLAIIDEKRMKRSLLVFVAMFAGFFLHGLLGIEPGVIALAGSMIMLLICRNKSDDALMSVEWGVVFFFIGMFMMIGALEANGVISWIGYHVIHMAGKNLFLVCIVVLWGSAVFSSILDNIPFVIVMVPMVRHFVTYFAGVSGINDAAVINAQIAQPLWWCLALGACLGGNGTLVGASANIVMARISEKNRYPISFGTFLRYGSAFMVQSMVICTLYVWLRYFR